MSAAATSLLERALHLPGGARVLFSERRDGNLSSIAGAGAQEAAAARERLRKTLGVGALVRGHQVHGSRVRLVLDEPREESDGTSTSPPAEPADGQATRLRGIAVMVLSADCLPVALVAGDSVAMLHAGWRGLAAGVLEEGMRAVRALRAQSGGRGAAAIDPIALIGPGAGACCYEVGEEVHAAFAGRHRRGRAIDLRAIARERLLAAGAGEVLDAGGCTICDERYFSHRREGERAGRQAGIAWLS